MVPADLTPDPRPTPEAPLTDHPVVVTTQDIYQLLQEVRDEVRNGTVERRADAARIVDHENRLRVIEQREDLSRRVRVLEEEQSNAADEVNTRLSQLERRVWSIPSGATFVAVAALVITLIRWL